MSQDAYKPHGKTARKDAGTGGQCQGVGPGDGDRVTLGPPLLLCKLHFMQILDHCHKWKAQHRGGNFGCLWVPPEGFVLEEESLKLQPPHKRTGRVMPRRKGAGGQCAGGGSRLRSGHSNTLERGQGWWVCLCTHACWCIWGWKPPSPPAVLQCLRKIRRSLCCLGALTLTSSGSARHASAPLCFHTPSRDRPVRSFQGCCENGMSGHTAGT